MLVLCLTPSFESLLQKALYIVFSEPNKHFSLKVKNCKLLNSVFFTSIEQGYGEKDMVHARAKRYAYYHC